MAYDPSTQTVAQAKAKILAARQPAVAPTAPRADISSAVNALAGAGNVKAQQALSSGMSLNDLVNPKSAGYTQITTPNPVPSNRINSNITTQDVLDRRAQLEAQSKAGDDFARYMQSQGSTADNANMFKDFIFTQQDPALTSALNTQASLWSQAGDYIKGLFGQNSMDRYNQLNEDAGLADVRKQMEESNLRLADLRGQQLKIRPQVEGEAGQTRVGAEARLTPIERQLTAEIGAEALVQAALQGNMEMITANTDKLMELEFGDQDRNLKMFENRIKIEEARIKQLEGQAATQANQRLAAANIMLDDRKAALEAAKQEKSDLINFAKSYIEKTGDGAGAADIIKSGNLAGAMSKYGNSVHGATKADPFKSGAATFTKEQIQGVTSTLQASKGSDGFVNTALYFKERDAWLADGGLETDFIKFFPMNMLNPQDPTVVKAFYDQYRRNTDGGVLNPWG